MDAQGAGPTARPAVTVRPAQREDCRRIAELFQIASDGVSDYVWSTLRTDYPGLSLVEIGARRYAREGTPFSYQSCVVVEHAGAVVGMLHAFAMAPRTDPPAVDDEIDPVLRPYAELEAPGSLYISGIALLPEHRGRGLGTQLLAAARRQADALGCRELSLICLAANEGARRLYERHGFRVVARRLVVPHPLIRAHGEALLMTAPV